MQAQKQPTMDMGDLDPPTLELITGDGADAEPAADAAGTAEVEAEAEVEAPAKV